jgi:outer membrane biosynthesis protein TonB
MTISRTALFLSGLAVVAALVSPSVTLAEGEELAQCATQWKAAIANPKFYQPWQDYFIECKKKLAAEPAAKAAAEPPPPPQPEATKAEPPKPAPAVAAPAPAAGPAPAPASKPAAAPKPAGEPAKPAKPAHKPAKKPAQNKT